MDITDVNKDGIGLDGMDPVAHYAGEPLLGKKEFSFAIGDVTYFFVSKKNLEKFESSPAQYIPLSGSIVVDAEVGSFHSDQKNNRYIGNKTLEYRKDLEDTLIDNKTNIHNSENISGSVEMQNLSDSEK